MASACRGRPCSASMTATPTWTSGRSWPRPGADPGHPRYRGPPGAIRRRGIPGRAYPARAALPFQGLRPRAAVHRDPRVLRRAAPLRPERRGGGASMIDAGATNLHLVNRLNKVGDVARARAAEAVRNGAAVGVRSSTSFRVARTSGSSRSARERISLCWRRIGYSFSWRCNSSSMGRTGTDNTGCVASAVAQFSASHIASAATLWVINGPRAASELGPLIPG